MSPVCLPQEFFDRSSIIPESNLLLGAVLVLKEGPRCQHQNFMVLIIPQLIALNLHSFYPAMKIVDSSLRDVRLRNLSLPLVHAMMALSIVRKIHCRDDITEEMWWAALLVKIPRDIRWVSYASRFVSPSAQMPRRPGKRHLTGRQWPQCVKSNFSVVFLRSNAKVSFQTMLDILGI